MTPEGNRLHELGFQDPCPVGEVEARFFPLFSPLRAESVPLEEAVGRVAASDVAAAIDSPPFDRSAMDGYAVVAEDTFGASPSSPVELKVVGSVGVGEAPRVTPSRGECVEIATGAPVPPGCTAVVKVEDTRRVGPDSVVVHAALPPGKNVSKKGEDVGAGTVVVNAGVDLTPAHVGLLASLGVTNVQVARQPRVAILSTGDELTEPGFPLAPGKIYASNHLANAALLRWYGAHLEGHELLGDDFDSLLDALRVKLKEVDVVVFTGGTSVGKKDYLPRVVAAAGEVVVHGVAQRPGGPVLMGKVQGKPVFCLPGTPVANYVNVVKFVGPFVRYLQGAKVLDVRPVCFGRLAEKVSVKGFGHVHHVRVALQPTEGGFLVHPKMVKGSGVLSSVANTDGIVEVPDDCEGLEEGTLVKVHLHPK